MKIVSDFSHRGAARHSCFLPEIPVVSVLETGNQIVENPVSVPEMPFSPHSMRVAGDAIPPSTALSAVRPGPGFVEMPLQALGDALPGFKLVFPDADDFPTFRPAQAVHPAVSGLVLENFPVPEFLVGLGAPIAFRTAMPKAAVDENGDLFAAISKVGPARQVQMTPPTGEAKLAQEAGHGDFGAFVAP